MTESEQALVRAAIAATLRTISQWGSVGVDGGVTTAELHEIADQVQNQPIHDMWSCPICQESSCDPGCPMEPLRGEYVSLPADWAKAWEPPRCSHGNIILGCPEADCPEQNAYLAEMRAGHERWLAQFQLGMPAETITRAVRSRAHET